MSNGRTLYLHASSHQFESQIIFVLPFIGTWFAYIIKFSINESLSSSILNALNSHTRITPVDSAIEKVAYHEILPVSPKNSCLLEHCISTVCANPIQLVYIRSQSGLLENHQNLNELLGDLLKSTIPRSQHEPKWKMVGTFQIKGVIYLKCGQALLTFSPSLLACTSICTILAATF